MKFIFEHPTESFIFANVKTNQFFVCPDGCLWQKVSSRSANKIADGDGNPESDYDSDWSDNMTIERILPIVTKIEF